VLRQVSDQRIEKGFENQYNFSSNFDVIHGVSEGKINILRGDSIDHFKQKYSCKRTYPIPIFEIECAKLRKRYVSFYNLLIK